MGYNDSLRAFREQEHLAQYFSNPIEASIPDDRILAAVRARREGNYVGNESDNESRRVSLVPRVRQNSTWNYREPVQVVDRNALLSRRFSREHHPSTMDFTGCPWRGSATESDGADLPLGGM